ncbi:MAG: L-aspartate oxidase [Kiritimatiellae bacterium]|nr:L-aspartate oxidase [Kiritimatiellia bacterium]
MRTESCDYFIVGSGMAGLISAIRLASCGSVILVTKKRLEDCNTNFAQGGICCVQDPSDDFDSHVKDTLVAGAGLCNEKVVRAIVEDAPARIRDLESYGVSFAKSQDGSGYDLGREGGHSARRILHAGDITGARIEEALINKVRQDPRIQIFEYTMVIDLITTKFLQEPGQNRCLGAYVLHETSGEIYAVRSPHTILATGGCGKVYQYTCNPDVATGDGVALGWRAGAQVANMEFIQFHPTCLYHPQAKRFLISEAVRGEGATLTDRNGNPFMEKYDPRGALAPRDIVARAIDSEMKRTGAPCCFLDIRFKGKEFLQKRFPKIYETCLSFGVDMANDLIPIVPAAHYSCGGVRAEINGETSLPGLFAIGECACTGLHGANRLASNSLLEAVVCAYRCAEKLAEDKLALPDHLHIPDWQYGTAVASDEVVLVAHNWTEIRTCMWDYVGIVRTDKRLQRALHRLANLRKEIREYYFDYLVTPDTLELRNIALVGELIVCSARQRKESRGLHYTLDYPETKRIARDTILKR